MRNSFFYFLALLLIFQGCKLQMDIESNLYIINNSKKTIKGWYADISSTFPDTVLPLNNQIEYFTTFSPGKKDIIFSIALPLDKWDKESMHTIYIFDPDTLEKYTWEEVCKDYKILKRYDLSYEDLKEMDFEVVYP